MSALEMALRHRGFAWNGRSHAMGCVRVRVTDAEANCCTVTVYAPGDEQIVEWDADFSGAPADAVMALIAKVLP